MKKADKEIEENEQGQRIADLYKDYGISQKTLAEKVGLSASQLNRIISGKTSTINGKALIKMAETFKISTDYILGLSGKVAVWKYTILLLSN